MTQRRPHIGVCRNSLRCITGALLAVAFLSACSPSAPPPPLPAIQTNQVLVAAHYHVWYPSNFDHGFLRGRLDPPQTPMLGMYHSDAPTVAEQQIAWCSRYGIDVLTLDWWPNRPAQNAAIDAGFMQAANLADIQFCIFYEAWDLNFDPTTGATVFTPDVCDRFVREMCELGERYLGHPSYLRLDGRPVIILYLSRTFSGNYADAIARARRELDGRGLAPFFIGDEIFWGVMRDRDSLLGKPVPSVGPQPKRMACLDAVFGYNLYDWSKPAHAGYGATSDFLDDVAELYDRFRDAANGTAYLVPDIIPGYNDRGVRLNMDNYAIPRQWESDADGTSFLTASLDRIGLPYLDPGLNLLFITSFNEWNEDTAIEPLRSGSTRRDESERGYDYTEGYTYTGHGTQYLEMIQDRFVAIAGRVTSNAAPCVGVAVDCRQGSRIAARVTDHNGYYRIPRLPFSPGPATITVHDRTQPVTIRTNGCRPAMDFRF